MIDEHDRILEVVGLIYQAAIDPARWPDALTGIAAFVGATGATLLFGDATSADAAITQSTGIDPDGLALYNKHYVEQDVRLQVALTWPVGRVAINANLMPSATFRRTPFYNEFLEPIDLPYMIASILLKEEHAFSSLGLHRSRGQGEYSEAEFRRFEALVPHLQRAIDIHRRLYRAGVQATASTRTLDHLALGVILLDEQGRALFVNRSAREILAQKDGLFLTADGLHAARPDLTRALRWLVQEAVRTGCGEGIGAGGALSLARPSLRRPLALQVTPLPGLEQPFMPKPAVAAVFVSDPEAGASTAPEVLEHAYGLTRAEARLATLFLDGHTVDDAAAALQVSPLTVRTQLKSIFRKTGTNRQSELVRLLAGGLGQLRRPGRGVVDGA